MVCGCLIAVVLLLGGCSDFEDAVVFNPCAHPIAVRFGSGAEESTVDPESARRFRDALPGVGKAWSVEVLFPDDTIEEVPVPQGDSPVPVLIPARSCL